MREALTGLKLGRRERSRYHVRALLGLGVGLALCGLPRLARADGRDYREVVEVHAVPKCLTLPFEFGHAAAWVRDRTGPVYRTTASLLPGVFVGPLTLHVPLQGHYRNPGWDVAFGGRATLLVAPLAGGFVPVRAMVEATYLAMNGGAYVDGGLMFGLGSLAHLVLVGGRDTERDVWFLGIRLGVDVAALWDPVAAITRFVPQRDITRPSTGGE